MMTPPLSISARPDFTRKVPVSRSTVSSSERGSMPAPECTAGPGAHGRQRQRESSTATQVGSSWTQVRPGASEISVPLLATNVVTSSRPERSHRLTTTRPSRRTYPRPEPVSWTSATGCPPRRRSGCRNFHDLDHDVARRHLLTASSMGHVPGERNHACLAGRQVQTTSETEEYGRCTVRARRALPSHVPSRRTARAPGAPPLLLPGRLAQRLRGRVQVVRRRTRGVVRVRVSWRRRSSRRRGRSRRAPA